MVVWRPPIWGVKLTCAARFAGSLILWSLLAAPLCGQASIRLSDQPASSSQAGQIAGELLVAITQGASPDQTERLLDRAARVDQSLAEQLGELKLLSNGPQPNTQKPDAETRDAVFRKRSLLWLKRIEIASLSSELFPERTPDSLATANRAIRLARETLAVLPANSPVRDEVLRLLAEAYLKTGDAANAQKSLLAISSLNKTQPASTGGSSIDRVSLIAFTIRIALLKNGTETAKRRLDAYYGRDPLNAPKSIEMDLVRLRYLLAIQNDEPTGVSVGEWMDAIEQRHGPAIRRTAETFVIRARDEPSGSIQTPGLDPRIRRADAAYRFRTGQDLLAAATFARAAIDDDQADRAIHSAIASTAILAKKEKSSAAVEILLQVARKHPQHPQVDALQLQAAVIADQSDPEQVIEILRGMLEANSVTEAAKTARSWLVKLYEADENWREAAVVITQTPQPLWTDDTLFNAITMWNRTIETADCQWFDLACRRQDELRRQAAIETMLVVIDDISDPLSDDEVAGTHLLSIARSLFARPEEIVSAQGAERWFDGLAEFRRGNVDALGSPPAPWPRLVASALHRDALKQPTRRRTIGSALLSLPIEGNAVEKMQWLFWSHRIRDGLAQLARLRSTEPRESKIIAIAARSLQQAGGTQSLSQATRLWNELASGLPTSAPAWAEAKISAIECQALMGQQAKAAGAAKWMLLVHPPKDESRADRLQALAEVGG